MVEAIHRAPIAARKPRLRGVSHAWAFFAFLAIGVATVILAPAGKATLAALIYAASVVALFGTSALYHRIDWESARSRRAMRRLDHAMIFVLIAGSYTPFALLVVDGSLSTVLLATVWGGALAGVIMKVLWIDAPKWLSAVLYVALGWIAIATGPAIVGGIGIPATFLVAAGGLLYTAGAVVYVSKRPNPAPTVFGYHEIFHALVIVAAALQYAVIAFVVLPDA